MNEFTIVMRIANREVRMKIMTHEFEAADHVGRHFAAVMGGEFLWVEWPQL